MLASATTQFEAISKGIVDAGNVTYAYTPSLAPAVTLVADMPGTIQQVSAAAVTETLMLDCPQCKEELDALGVTFVANASTEPFSLICTKKDVASLADLKGAKVRATGALARLMAAVGATPVNITFAEIYEGFQRGQIDCTAIGAATLATLQLWDVADSVTVELPLGTVTHYGLLLVNSGVWNGLSAEDKRIMLDAAPGIVADNGYVTLKSSGEAMVTATTEKSMKAVEADPELQAAVKDALAKQADDAVASARDRGVKDPEAIVAAFTSNVDKWTQIYNEIGSDGNWNDDQWATFRARLKSEIYDNVSVQ